ncbi:hypothetical protein H6F98_13725 [Microcoleus sp. FACHB-SPT15]|uniref:hypothetical protein n=1 Tax=Microcoleus sp. FACHB-SPT15 TaxID=2692830 RepID=UPI0017831F03|nr:hypothetical protein [Microcoleus sp. FACHB-SPT15]MBD1806505.1 hypothetical protein [Microcoleus sp. FACHB-SPT15]
MFDNFPSDNPAQPTLNIAPLQELVVALSEENEELLLGGSVTTVPQLLDVLPADYNTDSKPKVAVLLFANPFA